jgi:hypothetical protein
MKIDISKYDPAEILMLLHNKAGKLSLIGEKRSLLKDLPIEEARIIYSLTEDKYFSEVRGRLINIDLHMGILNAYGYDKLYGKRAALKVLQEKFPRIKPLQIK